MASPALGRPVRLQPGPWLSALTLSMRLRSTRMLMLLRRDPRTFGWLLLWLPFWVGSELPPPSLPGHDPARAVSPPLDDPAGSWLQDRTTRFARRFSLTAVLGSVLRGLTLALLVVGAWLAIASLTAGEAPGWRSIWLLLGGGVLLGSVYGWLTRPHAVMVAQMLDRTFMLRERMVTAFTRANGSGLISRLQLADAANALEEVSSEIPRTSWLPVREAALVLIAGATVFVAALSYVPHDHIVPAASNAVPAFVPASERLLEPDQALPQQAPPDQPVADQPSIAEIEEQGEQQQSTREGLARIGEALDGNGPTQQAADAIADGDYGAAADSLRENSEAISTMSQEERDALANDLDQAADDLESTNPELAESARQTADAVREGGDTAEKAIDDLAEDVEQAGASAEQESTAPNPSQEGSQGDSASEQPSGDAQQPGESGGEQGGSEGEPADPGEGQAAEPGLGNQGEDSEPTDSEGAPGEGDGTGSSSEGQGDQPADDPGSSVSEPGDQQGEGESSDEGTASQGSNAGSATDNPSSSGSNDGDNQSPSEAPSLTPPAEAPSQGEAVEDPPSGDGDGGGSSGSGSASQGSSTLELEGTSDESVQSGNDGGSSSLGSGGDSSTASGDQAQSEVGIAGPDSNRVPEALRDIVRDFFGEEP